MQLEVADCLLTDAHFGHELAGSPRSHLEVESEEVVAVPHVRNPGLFLGQPQTARFPEEIADCVAEFLGVPLVTACQKHTPIVGVPGEPDIGSSFFRCFLSCLAVKSLGMEEPVQFVQHGVRK